VTAETLTNFKLGLEITALGMALVFLTLIIVMLVIYLLDRIFRPTAEQLAAAQARKPAPAIAPAEAAALPPAQGEDVASAEAAAIAVAIALAKSASGPSTQESLYDEELVGEVVTVISIEPGPSTWKAQGRLQALQ